MIVTKSAREELKRMIEYQGQVVLLVDPELGKQLMNATFDFTMSPQGPRFKLDVRPIMG